MRKMICWALALVVLSAATAEAQTTRTLVSNLGQPHDSRTNSHDVKKHAQKFTTGDEDAILRSVSMDIANYQTSLTITVRSGSEEGTLVATLTHPTTPSGNDLTFTAPADTQLTAKTDYYLLFIGGPSGTTRVISYTNRGAEDSDSDPGWSIENAYRVKVRDNAWRATSGYAFRMRLEGHDAPMEPKLTMYPSTAGSRPKLQFDLKLRDEVRISNAEMRDHSFSVTGGRLTSVARIRPGKRNGKTYIKHWRMRVQPNTADTEAIVTLLKKDSCDDLGALCTDDDIGITESKTLNLGSLPENGPLTISIEAATAEEGEDLVFTMNLSRAAPGQVFLRVARTGGTATKDDFRGLREDYPQIIDVGDTDRDVTLHTVDDDIDDPNETVVMEITEARFFDSNRAIRVSEATATGTITNSDAVPRALLSRFGRAVAVQVVDNIEDRMEAGREPGVQHDLASLWSAEGGAVGDTLAVSGFALNREAKGGVLSVWSRGAQTQFAGRDGMVAVDGDMQTTMFGADYAKGPLVAGLSLAHSRGLGAWDGAVGGEAQAAMTGLYPWLGYRVSERVSVWGVAGYGSGGMAVRPEGGGGPLDAGLSMSMAAVGTRGELAGGPGYEVAFKADALWVGMATGAVESPNGTLAATAVGVTRLRTGIESSWAVRIAGLSLRPLVEVGLRQDGGDADIGAGVDVGTGVRANAGALAVDVRVRRLLVHQAEGFGEHGVALAVSWNPSSRLGLSAKVAPSWGAEAQGAADALWSRGTMVAGGMAPAARRLDGEIGYGLPVGVRFVGTPRVGFSTSEHGRAYRAGYGLGVLEQGDVSFEVGVDAQRRESPMLGRVDNGVLGRAVIGW